MPGGFEVVTMIPKEEIEARKKKRTIRLIITSVVALVLSFAVATVSVVGIFFQDDLLQFIKGNFQQNQPADNVDQQSDEIFETFAISIESGDDKGNKAGIAEINGRVVTLDANGLWIHNSDSSNKDNDREVILKSEQQYATDTDSSHYAGKISVSEYGTKFLTDGKTAYLYNFSEKKICKIDLETGEETASTEMFIHREKNKNESEQKNWKGSVCCDVELLCYCAGNVFYKNFCIDDSKSEIYVWNTKTNSDNNTNIHQKVNFNHEKVEEGFRMWAYKGNTVIRFDESENIYIADRYGKIIESIVKDSVNARVIENKLYYVTEIENQDDRYSYGEYDLDAYTKENTESSKQSPEKTINNNFYVDDAEDGKFTSFGFAFNANGKTVLIKTNGQSLDLDGILETAGANCLVVKNGSQYQVYENDQGIPQKTFETEGNTRGVGYFGGRFYYVDRDEPHTLKSKLPEIK